MKSLVESKSEYFENRAFGSPSFCVGWGGGECGLDFWLRHRW
jgi:hypothetical protein